MKLTPQTKLGMVRNIFICLGLCLIVNILMGNIYYWLYSYQYSDFPVIPFLRAASHPFKYYDFLTENIQAPIWEELQYRLIPIEAAIIIGANFLKEENRDNLLILTILFSSLLFGFNHYGVTTVYVQGVHGLLFSLLYLLNGKGKKGYFSIVLVHALINVYGTFFNVFIF